MEEVYVQGLKRLASRRQDTVGGLGYVLLLGRRNLVGTQAPA